MNTQYTFKSNVLSPNYFGADRLWDRSKLFSREDVIYDNDFDGI